MYKPCIYYISLASTKSAFESTGVDDIGDKFIGTIATVTLLLITISTLVLVIAILCRKRSVKVECVEPVYDIPEPINTGCSSQHDTDQVQKEEMTYNVAYGRLSKPHIPRKDIQEEEMEHNVAYAVCKQ